MGITSAIVLFAVVWFMTFFIVLPLRLTTQGEAGEVVPGTHKSAPADAQVGRKARITTYFAIPIWAVLATVILSGWISVRDLDWFDRMATPTSTQDNGVQDTSN
jgi:predicted secreted protein